MADVEITVIGTGFMSDPHALEESIIYGLEEGTPELVQLLLFLVTQKSPELTGALISSYEGIPNQAHGDPDLAYVYASDGAQIDEWGRVYAPYVEGGALGLATYTNPPREMFARTATENIPEIELWAEKWVQLGCDRWVVAGSAAA
jgi:hypothetical protein